MNKVTEGLQSECRSEAKEQHLVLLLAGIMQKRANSKNKSTWEKQTNKQEPGSPDELHFV